MKKSFSISGSLFLFLFFTSPCWGQIQQNPSYRIDARIDSRLPTYALTELPQQNTRADLRVDHRTIRSPKEVGQQPNIPSSYYGVYFLYNNYGMRTVPWWDPSEYGK